LRPDSYLAGSGSRVIAYISDLLLAGLAFLFVVNLADGAGMDFENGPIFALVLFMYHAYFLAGMHGASLGKNMRSIFVVSARGGTLVPKQAVLRAALVALPYAGFGAHHDQGLISGQLAESTRLLCTLWLLADFGLLMWTPQRRTLPDRLAGTIVVNVPPVQPHRAPAVPMYSATDTEFGTRPKQPPSRKASNPSIERTSSGRLRLPTAAAHVER
jgi:uncharacterized RDD family membrane protein YckC